MSRAHRPTDSEATCVADIQTDPTQLARWDRLRDRHRNRRQGKKRDPIVYFGLNPNAEQEAEHLANLNADGGGVLSHSKAPKDPNNMLDFGPYDMPNTIGEDGKEVDERGQARLDLARDLCLDEEKTALLLKLFTIETQHSHDMLVGLLLTWHAAERGRVSMRRLVLSGESQGAEMFSNEQALTFYQLELMAQIFPLAAQTVEHLHLAACNSGGEYLLAQYRRTFPNLKTVWAYAGSAPSTDKGALHHLRRWQEATESGATDRIDPSLVAGSARAENVSTWSAGLMQEGDSGYRGPPPTEIGLIRQYDAAFSQMMSGELEVQPYSGSGYDYYLLIVGYLRNPDALTDGRAHWEYRRYQMLLLRFYKNVSAYFSSQHRETLAKGYAELGLPLPDFAGLSRKEAMREVESFTKRVAGRGPSQEILRAGELLQKLASLDPETLPPSAIIPRE